MSGGGAVKGGLQCCRCGANDHGWRNCPMHWQRNLAFGNLVQKGKAPLKITPKFTMLLGDGLPDSELSNTCTHCQTATPMPRTLAEPQGADATVPESEIRITEAEWVEQFNLHANNDFARTASIPISIYEASMGECLHEDRIVLDSGASSSIISLAAAQSSVLSKHSVRAAYSKRCFRFGDSRLFQRCGLYRITLKIHDNRANGVPGVRTCCFVVDDVDCRVPFLLPRASMAKNGCVLDFPENTLNVKNDWIIRSALGADGHLSIPLSKLSPPHTSKDTADFAFASDELRQEVECLTASAAEIRKLHLHLEHASAITRIPKTAGMNIALDQVKVELPKCSCVDTFQRA